MGKNKVVIVLPLKEHESKELANIQQTIPSSFQWRDIDFRPVEEMDEYMGVPTLLGLNYSEDKLTAGYYVGAVWLENDNHHIAATVAPKIENIDFMKMFADALSIPLWSEYFAKCYGIQWDEDFIPTQDLDAVFTPLLALAYYKTLLKAIEHGLKRGYRDYEENLRSIRGRIVVNENICQNVLPHRLERTFCHYSEFTEDIPENRILKKALTIVLGMIGRTESLHAHEGYSLLMSQMRRTMNLFNGVGDDVQISEVRNVTKNKLYRNYNSAIEMAKNIIRRCDTSISDGQDRTKKVLPFWIDMPRLYEIYVYGVLIQTFPDSKIEFQVKGHFKSAVDYLKIDDNEKLILDAKYKHRYENSNQGMLPDIRELSGYARDTSILRKLGVPTDGSEMVNCVLLYPNSELGNALPDDSEGEESKKINFLKVGQAGKTRKILDKCVPIPGFVRFYKLGIEVPTI